MEAELADEADATGTGDMAGYRPMSPLAVAAVALGAASMLALVGPAFWMLPLVATAVSLAALVDVGRPGAPKAGRLAALAGLALALGFGAQAVAAVATAEWLARSRAEAAARLWLEAIAAGRVDDAKSMCGPAAGAAVDDVAACLAAMPSAVRFRGRHEETGGRVVRATGGACVFDILLTADPPRGRGDPERLTIARCAAVTPSAK